MNGAAWQEHFEKKTTPALKKLHTDLDVVLSDPALKKEYGAGAGLDTIRFFVAFELEKRARKRK